MFRYIIPTILVAISISLFFMFTDPLYKEISTLKANVVSYDEALTNYKTLQTQRTSLTGKQNAMSQENLTRLEKLLPPNIDNIRLILEIEKIASFYNMVLKNIRYDATDKKSADSALAPAALQGGGTANTVAKDYGIWNLEFSTVGTYNNFLKFTRDLEDNLRIIDVSSIAFSSNLSNLGMKVTPASEVYNYDFKIKTYWLKN